MFVSYLVQILIEIKMNVQFVFLYFEVINESYMYSVLFNLEIYFKLVVVIDVFEGKCLVVCYQIVYKILVDDLVGFVYVFVLYMYMFVEWS